jgi:hypothetical protein
MESRMLKMLKSKNPDIDYPSNTGQKWTEQEELSLLDKLNKGVEIEEIAKEHSRTVGGINSRRREIAYKLYLQNVSTEDIVMQTKLDSQEIGETIKRRENICKKDKICKKEKICNDSFSIESEIYEMKKDIKEIKNAINLLVEINIIFEKMYLNLYYNIFNAK